MNSHVEKRTQFSDIPYDLIKVIKNHVTNFQNNDEEYNFLSNFKEGKNKDIYKFFFIKNLIILNQVYMNMKCLVLKIHI
jgi:hypothetical protein